MLSFIWNMIPGDYKWSVAIKKASYTIAKLAVAGIVALGVGDKVDVKHLEAFQEVLGLIVAGGLELGHDWAKMKWPNAKWL